MSNNKGFFKKLMDGDFGLAKTYWLYGFLVNIILSVIIQITIKVSSILFLAVYLIAVIYSIILLIGVWRAANRYNGAKIWAILARVAVTLGALSSLAGLAIILSALPKILAMH